MAVFWETFENISALNREKKTHNIYPFCSTLNARREVVLSNMRLYSIER